MWGGRKLRFIAAFVAIAIVGVVLGGVSTQSASAISDSAIISNGTVQLGVWAEGHLNVPGGIPSSGGGNTIVGLRYVPTNAEATADGCTCEGWGAADETSGVSGSANDDFGAPDNITVESFTHTATTAASTVTIGSTMRVVHDYHPSSNANLYEVAVSITNISASPIHLLYRRVMDWDIEPTAFSEYVTMVPGSAPELVYTSDGGFASADPLDPRDDEGAVGAFVDDGPDDHGALFDFDFGSVPAGFTKSFKTYYGAAGNETDALSALSAVGAQAYSLGQPSTEGGPTEGTPNTFMFGFGSISSVPAPLTTPTAAAKAPTPCIGGIVSSRCPGNPPEVNVTVTPEATATGAAETATSVPPTAAAVPPTATPPGGGAAGVITGPNTGSGPGGSSGSPTWIALALALLATGAGFAAAAKRVRRP